MNALPNIRFDNDGLVPAIVQDDRSGEVLMLAYMNRESLAMTLEKGETYFWSRSRKEIWRKGATSGHKQIVRSVSQDCDSDALLLRVEQIGAACHTGNYSCFFTPVSGDPAKAKSLGEVLGALARVIHQRNLERPEGSYTTRLLGAGLDRVLKKIGEESGEVIIAAKNNNRDEIAWEVADLLYHLLVMLEMEGVGFGDIAVELEKRRGKSTKKEG